MSERATAAGIRMTIGNELVPGRGTFEVTDPATEQAIAVAPDCDREQLDAAFTAAADAFGLWADDDAARRGRLRNAADIIAAAQEDLARLLTAEQGKTLRDARLEIRGALKLLRYFTELRLPPLTLRDDDRARVVLARRPLGVTAAITPWNFPIHLAMSKIAPALVAGNTMVLKPSPYTPLTTLWMGELLAPALPPGVLNVVSGGDELGEWMTAHPVPRKVSFTGSVPTGKHVAGSAARDLKHTTLELGGNDPAIILPGTDVGKIADGVFWGAFANSGQICAAVKRVYAPEDIYAELVEALAERARTVRVGPGMDPGSQLGPLNNRPQFERVSELADDAIESGARAAAGGSPLPGPGYFFAPTVLAEACDGMRIVDEEQFGPVLPLVRYRSLEDAVERANATHFGLSGSVWGYNEELATAVAGQLDCGTVWINTHLAFSPDQPISGTKWSCLGAENGEAGLASYTNLRVLHLSRR